MAAKYSPSSIEQSRTSESNSAADNSRPFGLLPCSTASAFASTRAAAAAGVNSGRDCL